MARNRLRILRELKMIDSIEAKELKEHPIEASEYYKRSDFRDKVVYRLLSTAFSNRFRDLKEATGLSEREFIGLERILREWGSNETYDKEQEEIAALIKYLRNTKLEVARRFLVESFGERADEEIEFVPNGTEIGNLLSDILFNDWFKPKTPLLREELEARVAEMGKIFNFGEVPAKETPYLDEAIHSGSGEASCYPSYKCLNSIICGDGLRINRIIGKLSTESYEKSKKEVTLMKSTGKFLIAPVVNLKDFLYMKLFPVKAFRKALNEHYRFCKEMDNIPISLETKRYNLALDFGQFVNEFTSSLIKQIMQESRDDFEKAVKEGNTKKSGIYDGHDWYEDFYMEIVSRRIGDNLGNYAEYLIGRDMIPDNERYCIAEDLFNFHKQGYWFAGLSKEDDGHKKAIFWHL